MRLTVPPCAPAAGCLQNYGGDAQAGSCVACPTGSQQDLGLASVTNGATNPVTCSEQLPALSSVLGCPRSAARSTACWQAQQRAPSVRC